MRSRSGQAPGGGGRMVVAIIAVILIGFILYILLASPEQREELIPGYERPGVQEYYNELLPNASPGLLQTGNETEEIIEIEFDDIKIDGLPRELSKPIANYAKVERSWIFTHNDWEHRFTLPNKTLVNSQLSFNVDKKRGNGELLVYLNKEKIFSGEAGEAQNIKISLPADKVGNESTIKIDVTAGFLGNWYELRDIYLLGSQFYPEAAEAEQEFELEEEDIIGLQSAELFIDIDKIEKATSKPVTITINNKTIYDTTPTKLGDIEIDDIPTDVFVEGDNKIIYSTQVGSGYDLSDILLNLTRQDVRDAALYDIYVADNDWPKVQSSDYECILYVERASGDNSIWIKLNDNNFRYSFAGNTIEVDVCRYLKEGKNTLSLKADTTGSAEGEIDVALVRLYVQKK